MIVNFFKNKLQIGALHAQCRWILTHHTLFYQSLYIILNKRSKKVNLQQWCIESRNIRKRRTKMQMIITQNGGKKGNSCHNKPWQHFDKSYSISWKFQDIFGSSLSAQLMRHGKEASLLLAALCHKSFMFTIRPLSLSLQPQSLADKELQDLDYCTSELICRV